MSVGVALYNTDNLSSQQAYRLAELFFQLLSIPITDAVYYHDGVTYTHVVPAELVTLIAADKVTDFRIYFKDDERLPWVASFGHTTDLSGSFYHIDMQYADNLDANFMRSFLKQAAEMTSVSYGIGYNKDNVVDVYEYVLDAGVVPVPFYEKLLVWRDETPGMFNGPARYKDSMLRMVYPFNILNKAHLAIQVEGKRLEDWINSNTVHGQLTALTGELWLWEVAENQLENMNRVCGEAGILIAWKAQ